MSFTTNQSRRNLAIFTYYHTGYIFPNPVRESAAGTSYAENAVIREQKPVADVKKVERKVEPVNPSVGRNIDLLA